MTTVKLDQMKSLAVVMMMTGREMVQITSPETVLKPDGSPVTLYDLNAERIIRGHVDLRWPGLPVLAEEECRVVPDAECYASIDPLDGTKEFIRGGPGWGMSVAIMCGPRAIAGIVVQPTLFRAFVAIRGLGVYMLSSAEFLITRWRRLAPTAEEDPPFAFDVNDTPEYVAHCFRMSAKLKMGMSGPRKLHAVAAGVEVTEGTIAGWWSPSVHHWDIAATSLLIEEQGGVVECLSGAPVPWRSIQMPSLVLARSKRHADMLREGLEG